MQVSLEALNGLERRLTIEVPANQVESQIQSRLQEAAKTMDMKGFRKGKVPIKVIKSRFGKGVRQEVVGEVMSQSYYEAVNQENLRPAGQPKIEAKSLDEGKDLEFIATFEVYPDVTVGEFSALQVEKKISTIENADIDRMVETLREQKKTYAEVDRASKDQDQLSIDFVGTIDGDAFDGGTAKGSQLILGSNQMIPGFEDGLLGAKKGDEKILSLTFPDDYQNKEFAGKAAEFTVQINLISEAVLPELNDEFFASFDVIDGGEKAFREEVSGNMLRELNSASRNNIKTQVIDGLVEHNSIEIPTALLENEINVLRQQAMQQFGGGANIDQSMLPAELFTGQAEKRVTLGLIMNEIVKQKGLQAEAGAVRGIIEEMAESYEQPEEVIKYYYSNEEELAKVESMALEDAVIDLILESAQINEVSCSYEDALKPVEAKSNTTPEEKAEKEDEESVEPKPTENKKTKAKPKVKAKSTSVSKKKAVNKQSKKTD